MRANPNPDPNPNPNPNPNFYQAGDGRGPAGTLAAKGLSRDPANNSSWFVVYRPCSRDSIAKMLGRVGVGKGLNIKVRARARVRVRVSSPLTLTLTNAFWKALRHATSAASCLGVKAAPA